MAGRPTKTKVSYFQHDVSRGKTVMIMRSEYGNDGYAFWFGLLEMIGNSDGSYIRLNEIGALDYLSAWCGVNNEKTLKMLDTLVNLETIDPVLYRTKNVIWCQKFIDRLDHLHKRRQYTPVKPGVDDIAEVEKVNDEIVLIGGAIQAMGTKGNGVFDPALNTIQDSFPTFDVKQSFARFKEFNETKNREMTKQNWEWWWNEDRQRGKYKKPKDPNQLMEIECPKCSFKKEVKYGEREKGHFCPDEECGAMLSYGNVLMHERATYQKVGK